MMATEATHDHSNEAIVTSESELAIKIDTEPRNADSDDLEVNGVRDAAATDEIENRHITDIVDDLVNSAEVSISGGSDTEASRHDPSRLKDDEKGHTRTSSAAKKPTTFKSVSVNKTFLASKGATSSAPSKVAEKLAGSSTLAPAQAGPGIAGARPRLVAKTGSGLRDSLPRSSGANGGRPAAAPDPNVVWNKNRPVPVPDPKKFTDEELKKYGIHMANRLQSDDARGQANWADIEDDDEDWAPDAITWADGMKIAIPHVEEQVLTPVSDSPVPSTVREAKVVEKPKSPAPSAPSSSPSVKPGVLASGKGLVLKGAPEKPTLVAKPPAPPTPVKSPWAPLPKIDKASPIVMDLAPTHAGGRYIPRELQGSRDVPGAKSATPPPPPKEIAADDFSRAPWRDGPGQGSRELFNSQSGRYEPVTDRRSSMRAETHHRQPALLQRSSQSDQHGPAEPSPAFQTSRTSGQDAPYGRRRNSSNVSGGSGSYVNRFGKLPPHEMPHPPPELLSARRGSLSLTGGSESPSSPRNFSPSGLQSGAGPRHHQQPAWQQQPPPGVSPGTLHATPYNSSSSAEVNLVPPANPPSATMAPAEDDFEVQKRIMRERRELAMKRRLEEEARAEAAKQERIRLKLEAMGPAPERKSAKKDAVKNEDPSSGKTQDREASPSSQLADAIPTKIAERSASERTDSQVNGVQSQIHNQKFPESKGPTETLPPQENKHAHPWNPNQTERFSTSTWGTAAQSSAKNVWASPSSDRSLGNGTFISDLGRVPDSTGTAQLSQVNNNMVGPGPIAPPNVNRRGATAQSSMPEREIEQAPARQPPIAPPPRIQPGGLSASERNARASAWVNAARENTSAIDHTLKLQREAEARRLQAEGLTAVEVQTNITDKWRPVALSEEGKRVEDSKRKVATHGTRPTWTVQPGDSTGQPQNDQTGTTRNETTATSILTANGSAAAPSRASRFFPATRDIRQEPGYMADIGRPKSPSPPPPDTDGHPAFDGDASHPHVALPRPQPVVRLPPPAQNAGPTAPPQSAPAGPNFSWANPQPYIQSESPTPSASLPKDWQAKFDSLTGRTNAVSPPKPTAVDSLSRNISENSSDTRSVPISSPRIEALKKASDNDRSVTTRVMAEDCFDQQEMGSLPEVRIPMKTPDLAWQPAQTPARLPQKFKIVVHSIDPWDLDSEITAVRILLPYMDGSKSKLVAMPFTRSRSNPRRGARGGRHSLQTHRGGNKGRDSSSTFSPDQGSTSNIPSSSTPRGGRGGFRARSENWSRNSPPVRT